MVLPDNMIEGSNTIWRMEQGQTGWIEPDAMWVDQYRQCSLNKNFFLRPQPDDDHIMKVVRTADGYSVFVPGNVLFYLNPSIPWDGANEDDITSVFEVRVLETGRPKNM